MRGIRVTKERPYSEGKKRGITLGIVNIVTEQLMNTEK
jgi:hypothetical protein